MWTLVLEWDPVQTQVLSQVQVYIHMYVCTYIYMYLKIVCTCLFTNEGNYVRYLMLRKHSILLSSITAHAQLRINKSLNTHTRIEKLSSELFWRNKNLDKQ